jgi:DNA-binding MarR family transcriptional regulator
MGEVWQTPVLMTPFELNFDPIVEARRNWMRAGWDDAERGMANVTSIMRIQQLLLARINGVLRPHGLTFARFELLMLLQFTRRGALPLGKISARLQVQAGAITSAVDRLEADGLVRREPHPSDGRATLAAITRQGRALVLRAADDLNTEVFANHELQLANETLFEILRAIRQAAGDQIPGAVVQEPT